MNVELLTVKNHTLNRQVQQMKTRLRDGTKKHAIIPHTSFEGLETALSSPVVFVSVKNHKGQQHTNIPEMVYNSQMFFSHVEALQIIFSEGLHVMVRPWDEALFPFLPGESLPFETIETIAKNEGFDGAWQMHDVLLKDYSEPFGQNNSRIFKGYILHLDKNLRYANQ